MSDSLRQGDLLMGLPFPKRGTLTLSEDEMRADVYPRRVAIVLDQCCTIYRQHTVLLGKVGRMKLPADAGMRQALEAPPGAKEGYAKYWHLLEPHTQAMPEKSGHLWMAQLLERVSVAGKTSTDLEWLHEYRVARMSATARAHLRLKLLLHFTNVADEDVAELEVQGLTKFGLPVPEQDHHRSPEATRPRRSESLDVDT